MDSRLILVRCYEENKVYRFPLDYLKENAAGLLPETIENEVFLALFPYQIEQWGQSEDETIEEEKVEEVEEEVEIEVQPEPPAPRPDSLELARVLYRRKLWNKSGCLGPNMKEDRLRFFQEFRDFCVGHEVFKYNFDFVRFHHMLKHGYKVSTLEKLMITLMEPLRNEMIQFICNWLRTFRTQFE